MLTFILFIFILTTTCAATITTDAATITTDATIITTGATVQTHYNRRILHQPLFPLNSYPPISQPPLLSPKSQPEPEQKQDSNYPFTTQSPPTTQLNFFPFYPSPPPPPPSTFSGLPTFPANISSLSLPQTSSLSKPISKNLTAVVISVVLSAVLISGVVVFFLYHRKHHFSFVDKVSRSDSLRLFPPNTAISDGGHKPPGPPQAPGNVSSTSSEFLYLGTLVNSRGNVEEYGNRANRATSSSNACTGSPARYQKLGSPELRPLPPLPKQNLRRTYRSSEMDSRADAGDDDEEFFSPRVSSVGKRSPDVAGNDSHEIGRVVGDPKIRPAPTAGMDSRTVFQAVELGNIGNRSLNSRTASYPSSSSVSPSLSMSSSPSILFNSSPRSLISKSPDSIINFPAPPRPIPPPPMRERKPRSPSPPFSPPERTSGDTQNSPVRFSDKLPPSPPPLPPERYWEAPVSGPPVFSVPSNPFTVENSSQNVESKERNEENLKPKLKPLHWDKVRASSDRAMVWDQLKSSSFQLNEEMIETLFMVNTSNLTPKDNARPFLVSMNQENRVLDPKKSQNIAILLRALNVTIDEVCESLLEGNTDTMGAELLESLLKMAPTKEEERKLKDFKDDSPFKLGPAEKFLKAVLDVPFAFKRVDAMLYIANFDSEIEYLNRSFGTLEAACEELRNSRMFMKLLEAVLKTGNRMNIGTHRGDAHAFELDTLLKLVDVKGTDGKTTLLHFVVQEIIRSEGLFLSNGGTDHNPTAEIKQSTFRDDIEFRKLGLQVVSGLGGELINVKKSAAMESNILSNEVTKLASGISKIKEVLKLNEESPFNESTGKFSISMNAFLKKAEMDIIKIQAQESIALCKVKEITEYFHGNSTKEEARPLRIFTIVRDFLCVLDKVCKEVGKINERTIMSSVRQFPLPVNAAPAVFPMFNGRQEYSSSEDESSSSST